MVKLVEVRIKIGKIMPRLWRIKMRKSPRIEVKMEI